jgi:hypothetical protein
MEATQDQEDKGKYNTKKKSLDYNMPDQYMTNSCTNFEK